MKHFKGKKNIMTTKESNKIIRTYNKVARARLAPCMMPQRFILNQ